MEFWLPYGKTEVPVAVPDENLLGFLSPAGEVPGQSLVDAVAEVSRYQVGQRPLLEAARGSTKVAIAFNGKSASCVSLSRLLAKELSERGAKGVFLVEAASDPTEAIPSPAVPEDFFDEAVPLVKHDRRDSPTARVGELETGGEVSINEAFLAADIRCTVTNVTVNSFWGYCGGPAFLVLGLGFQDTIKACLAPTMRGARLPGVFASNPTYEALRRASKEVRVDIGVHTVEAPNGTVAGIFVGAFMETFHQASSLAERMFRPQIDRKADIVISSAGGVPWDSTLYQAFPCFMTAASACKDHGMLVLVAECADGAGGLPSGRQGQTSHARKGFSLERLVSYSLERLCAEHRIYLVSTLPEHHASSYGVLAARSVGNAFQRAIRHAGRDAKVVLMPQGCLTAPLVGEREFPLLRI